MGKRIGAKIFSMVIVLTVLFAVNCLLTNSSLSNIATRNGDYDSFVGVANQYYDDADNMNKILAGFAESMTNMEMTMRTMNEGIGNVSTVVDESARGVSNAAENARQLVDAISQIREETQTNQGISQQLSREVKKFKNV